MPRLFPDHVVRPVLCIILTHEYASVRKFTMLHCCYCTSIMVAETIVNRTTALIPHIYCRNEQLVHFLDLC